MTRFNNILQQWRKINSHNTIETVMSTYEVTAYEPFVIPIVPVAGLDIDVIREIGEAYQGRGGA